MYINITEKCKFWYYLVKARYYLDIVWPLITFCLFSFSKYYHKISFIMSAWISCLIRITLRFVPCLIEKSIHNYYSTIRFGKCNILMYFYTSYRANRFFSIYLYPRRHLDLPRSTRIMTVCTKPDLIPLRGFLIPSYWIVGWEESYGQFDFSVAPCSALYCRYNQALI